MKKIIAIDFYERKSGHFLGSAIKGYAADRFFDELAARYGSTRAIRCERAKQIERGKI